MSHSEVPSGRASAPIGETVLRQILGGSDDFPPFAGPRCPGKGIGNLPGVGPLRARTAGSANHSGAVDPFVASALPAQLAS